MITDKFIEIGFWLFDLLLSFLEKLPKVPDSFNNVVDMLIDFVDGGICVVNCFLDLNFIRVAIPIWLAIASVDKIYHIIMWILRKIPFLGIE